MIAGGTSLAGRLAIALPMILSVSSLLGQGKPTEYQVKAAYLFNFGKFLDQPSRPFSPSTGTFDICIVGTDRLGQSLDRITANEHLNNLAVRVVRTPEVANARGCAIVFFGSSEDLRIEKDLAVLAGTDALTVSDSQHFLERGGMVQFVLESSHVRFKVNLDAVARTHLVLSSELLRVASSVSGKPRQGAQP